MKPPVCPRPKSEAATAASATQRRRRLRGTYAATADRLYDDAEAEFLRAVERYQREHDAKFPTATEYLSILKSLGYQKP